MMDGEKMSQAIKQENPRVQAAPKKLTLFQQQESASLCRHAIETVGLYLANGIEISIKEAGISNREFWENLFTSTEVNPTGNNFSKKKSADNNTNQPKSILERRVRGKEKDKGKDKGKDKPIAVPSRPCWEMDYQACAKYFAYGNGRAKDDSTHFCKRFGVELCFPTEEGNAQEGENNSYQAFRDIASDCVWIRNNYMHITRDSLKGITAQSVWNHIEKLKKLTLPLLKTQEESREKAGGTGKAALEFDDLPPLKEFWKAMTAQCRSLLDEAPISIAQLGEEVYGVAELSSEQRAGLMEALAFLGIAEETGRINGDMIYKEADRKKLMGKLRYVGPIASEIHWKSTAETAEECERLWKEEQQKQEEERCAEYPPLEQVQWAPLTSEGLAFTQNKAELGAEELDALMNRFHILLDETIFMSSEGRNGLERVLLPALKQRAKKVAMDTSAIAGLFRAFRESKPLSSEELQELEEDAETIQERRKERHESCRKGIGRTLHDLKEADCLEVGRSLVDEEFPYRNLCRLAEKHPEERFLVLTCNESVAEELAAVRGHNAVAARFVRQGILGDFELQIYDATHKNWVDMMGLNIDPTEPKEVAEPSEKERETAAHSGTAQSEYLKEAVSELTADGEVQVKQQHYDADSDLLPVKKASAENLQRGDKAIVYHPDGETVEITLGQLLGAGGEGQIYAVAAPESCRTFAVKIYMPQNRTESRLKKLGYMIANDPGIDGLCWPKAQVRSTKNEWVGFLMPLAEGEPLAYTVYHLGEAAANIEKTLEWDRKDLTSAAAKVADLFAKMHRCGILMGDINPRNILVTKDCRVWFVDCDSYQTGGFPCPVGMVQYIPPEVLLEAGDKEVDYSFLRSERHEQYSLAVLLFEILMLGKAPYISRTNNRQDVKRAVIEKVFPYRFHPNQENFNLDLEEEAEDEALERKRLERMGLLAPAGVWTLIWSNTTYQVKKAFFETFKDGKRQTAEEWKQIMDRYVYEIEVGKATRELIPKSFKMLGGKEYDTVVCEECGESFAMLREEAETLRRKGKPIYCPYHREMMKILYQLEDMAQCSKCGKMYRERVKYLGREGFIPLCDDCGKSDAQCTRCGDWFRMKRTKKDDLEKQGKPVYCGKCFTEKTVCDECGEGVELMRSKYEWLRRANKAILCDECKQRRFAK